MSTQQPESLRLADAIHHLDEAEAEISRLHALNAELLEALKLNYAELSSQWTPYIRANEKAVAAMKAARAVFAKAEGREA